MQLNQNEEKAKRIVAIDFGLARLGVALSDETQTIATPLAKIIAEKSTEKTAAKLIAELKKHQEAFRYNIETIVIGMPLLLSGKSGMLADEVTHFMETMRALTSVPLVSWDERLTTVQAERSLREGNVNRKKRATVVDTVAAVIILQSYLDYKKIKNNL